MTHWKKLTNPDFLGAYELLSTGADMTLTIKSVGLETVTGTNGKKEDCVVCRFSEPVKPMILNKTNMDTIEKKLKYGPYIEQWEGKQITLYATKVKFGPDMVDALRIRPTVSNMIICKQCKNPITPIKDNNGKTIPADQVAVRLGGLCLNCYQQLQQQNPPTMN